MLTTTCPHCGARYRITPSQEERRFSCPSCQQVFQAAADDQSSGPGGSADQSNGSTDQSPHDPYAFDQPSDGADQPVWSSGSSDSSPMASWSAGGETRSSQDGAAAYGSTSGSFSNGPRGHGGAAATPGQTANIRCIQCGYDLTGVTIGSTCPECGLAVNQSMNATARPASGAAITSMVLGILALLGCFCYGVPSFFLGVPALIFGFVGHRAAREGRVSEGSGGMALAGMICGGIGTLIGVAIIGLILFAIIMG